jgi:DNA (cytosine-5)-methyltransferase 1
VVKPIATWSAQHQVWIIPSESQLFEQWALYQAVWPKSGMTVNGLLYELAMPAHLTGESESLYSPNLDDSMLRTPSVVDGTGGAISEKQARERGRMLKVADQAAQLAHENGLPVSASIAESLLPTPTLGHIRNHDEPVEDYLQRRKDFEDGKTKGMPGASLGVAVRMETLPTPNTMEHREIKTPEQIAELKEKSPGGYRNLREIVINESLSWGKFEPAIRVWELLTRPAPEPTLPDGQDGSHRLSSKFTEWMMGLPDGWITGHGLKRKDELKMAGNGVVPQQAELALRYLLQDVKLEKATSVS